MKFCQCSVELGVAPYRASLSWRNTYYVITENKIIKSEGIIVNYSTLKFEYILQVSVKVNVLDKIFDTGTNTIRAAGIKPFVLENVERPMEVRGIIEERTHNIKRP